jgi:Tannase and feruloyl esterase
MLRYLDQMHWLCTFLLFPFTWALPGEAEGAAAYSCTATGIPFPEVFGAEILSLSASVVTNYSLSLVQLDAHFPINITGLDFCNVSVQYTHPGQNDRINVYVWLPLSQWNGRFMGTGGGGFTTELGGYSLSYAVSLGYSAVSTDAGHISDFFGRVTWALTSPGSLNWALLHDFAAVALDDAATIGKAVTTAYYGSPPKYSYWNGCSTGGRQGMMMAQRYPSQYDGILAGAPGIDWTRIIPGTYWAQLVMNQLGMHLFNILTSNTYGFRCLSITL